MVHTDHLISTMISLFTLIPFFKLKSYFSTFDSSQQNVISISNNKRHNADKKLTFIQQDVNELTDNERNKAN